MVINTHKGLFRYKRLPYGIASAPAIWQRTIEKVLHGLEGVCVFMDDIIVTGATNEIHKERLLSVLKRLSDNNLRINVNKCSFLVPELEYCGHKISQDGIRKMDDKIAAIRDAPSPKNVSELRSFLGLVQYYSAFFPSLADIAHPLYDLLAKDVPFVWSRKCTSSR